MSKNISTELPNVVYVRLNDLIPKIVPFSAATVWRKVKTGQFPKPVKLSDRVTAWRLQDVREWMEIQELATFGSPIIKRRELTHNRKKNPRGK